MSKQLSNADVIHETLGVVCFVHIIVYYIVQCVYCSSCVHHRYKVEHLY